MYHVAARMHRNLQKHRKFTLKVQSRQGHLCDNLTIRVHLLNNSVGKFLLYGDQGSGVTFMCGLQVTFKKTKRVHAGNVVSAFLYQLDCGH